MTALQPQVRFVHVDLDLVLRPTLLACEHALNAGDTRYAEYLLNRCAEKCRDLGVPNTSARYRTLSLGAARQALGEQWDEESET